MTPEPSKGPPQAVLFDLFGTLVDESSERDALDAAMRDVRDRFEVEAGASDLAGEFVVILMDRIAAERDLPREAPIGPYEQAAREALDDLLARHGLVASDEDRAWFWRRLLAEFRAHVRTFPDALPCVGAVAKRVAHVGLLTDADPAIAGLIVEATGLRPILAAVTTAEEAGAFKPDPAPFVLALGKSGFAAERVAMVGDSWERDVVPALALGMRGVLLDRHAARTVAAPWKVRSLDEVPALLAV